MRTDNVAPTQTHTHLLAEPSLPDMFSGQAKLIYVKNENLTLGQRLKNFILKPLKIVAAKASLLNVLRDSAFKDNEEAKKLTNHIKSLGFFEGVSTFKVKDFLVDAALHGSRLASALDTNNNAKKSLTELTGAALNEHLTHPGHMYIALKHVLDEEDTGLEEFYHFQKYSSAELNSTQIDKIHLLNRRMEALNENSEVSKSIPAEVFIKFSEIYQGLSKILEGKDLILSGSNLIDRLSELKPRSTNVDYFLSFFKPKNENILGSAIKAQANIFKNGLEELADTLDSKHGKDATMRATLKILADEFIAHGENPNERWATAESIKKLNQDLKDYKTDEAKYWI